MNKRAVLLTILTLMVCAASAMAQDGRQTNYKGCWQPPFLPFLEACIDTDGHWSYGFSRSATTPWSTFKGSVENGPSDGQNPPIIYQAPPATYPYLMRVVGCSQKDDDYGARMALQEAARICPQFACHLNQRQMMMHMRDERGDFSVWE